MQLARNPLPRPLARLETEIATQERGRGRWATEAERLEAAGRNGRATRALLGIVEQRLAQLHRSREALLQGEEGQEDDEPA
jgi:hypothetical protein